MRRAFKVATVFTGAAATAAAFTPVLPANAAVQRPQDVIDCADHPTTSVHLYWWPSERHGPTCVGGHQYYDTFGDTRYLSVCAGNNDGWLKSYSVDYGNIYTVYYGTYKYGIEYTATFEDRALSISNKSWHGTSECSYNN